MILLTLSRGKGEETVRLQLPASPAEIGETFAFLDRISLDTTATAILDVSSNVPVLYRCLYDVDVEDSEQFQKLQKLAERTEALSPAKAAIFSGALDAECVWNLEGALSWCYYFSELYEQMGLVIEDGNGFDTMLLEKLEQRPEAADVTLTDECFDVCYYLDYCKNLAPEQPAPSLSAERKEEIISGILNYMAEYFDDSSLYDILHNTLEICNDEIGCLGFALYDEYVDEQIEASEVQSDLLPKSGRLVNLLSAYEELQQIPDEERITRLAPGAFGYCLDPNVPDERLHTAYQQALSALELESDEIQEAESFTSRDEIISRMRDCLLAKELTAGDKVLFVATEPYGGPGDFDLRGGVIESVDEKDKTCSVRGTFFTMEKVPLHYVLGRYNPAVGEEHYGVRGIVPFFCEDKELAGYYLNEVRTMWDVEMGEEQDLSM